METLNTIQEVPQWLLDDNDARKGKYARNESDELFLREFNAFLRDESPPIHEEINHPIIFFFGIPRCGKTFFSQMMNDYFDLGYPDNLIARFWQAPYFGIRLSELLKSKFGTQSDFSSDFGKTRNIFDPHDFAYFWHEHLLKNSHPYDFAGARGLIDWNELRKSLALFTTLFDKPCLFKGVNPSYHIEAFCKYIPNVYFIYLQRDPIDSAVSLTRARLKNYQDINHWFGQTPAPDDYMKMKDLPWAEQIASQLKWLLDFYESEIKNVDPKNLIRVTYRDFCDDPGGFFNHLERRIKETSGFDLKQKNVIQKDSMRFSTHDPGVDYYRELAVAFDKIGLSQKLII